MTETYYPPLSDGPVRALIILQKELEKDPNFLKYAPYSPYIKENLPSLLQSGGKTAALPPAQVSDEEIQKLDVAEEVARLYLNLQNFESHADTTLASNERLAYFRTSTALLEKLNKLKEASLDLKHYAKFKETILAAMARYLSEEQLNDLLSTLNQK